MIKTVLTGKFIFQVRVLLIMNSVRSCKAGLDLKVKIFMSTQEHPMFYTVCEWFMYKDKGESKVIFSHDI